MKTENKTLFYGFITALIVLMSFKTFSQTTCTNVPCGKWQNSDLSQLGGYLSDIDKKTTNTPSVTVLNPSVTVTNPSVTIVNPVNSPTVIPSSSQLTLSSITATASGTVTANAKSILFVSSSDFTGSIDGITFTSDTSLTLSSDDYHTLPQIVYVVTTGLLIIRKTF